MTDGTLARLHVAGVRGPAMSRAAVRGTLALDVAETSADHRATGRST